MLSEDSGHEIAGLFAARWWAVLPRGIIAIALGVLAFAWPGVTMATPGAAVWFFCAIGRRLLPANRYWRPPPSPGSLAAFT
jgi:uncharacterized membrane protein HdeD (DUF308 family)